MAESTEAATLLPDTLMEIPHEADPSPRETARRIRAFLDEDPSLKPRLRRAKAFRKVALYSGNYDLTSVCNLFCEGCFYFEGDDYKRAKEEADVSKWRAFFEEQRDRGVTYANIAGAEPALQPRRLEVAYEALPRGTVFTNGTIRIDPAIRYSLVVSLWGDEATTAEFRGGGVFWKSLKTYKGDPRARMLFTVHARNIAQVPEVTRIVADHGIKMSFNYFSPTDTYIQKLKAHAPNDDQFFRISSEDDNFILSDDALQRIRDSIDEMIDRYPETVFHSHAFNRIVTQPEGVYDIDLETGIALNCHGRNFRWHKSYRVDLKPSDAKCCSPNTNCSTCRLNAQALGSLMFQKNRFLGTIQDFRGWLDICEQWGRAHLLDDDAAWSAGDDEKSTSEKTSAPKALAPSLG